ncbi:MAG: hypothetical protein AB1Z66_04050, partial [Candidatus Limnocylindrales bacterium]
MMFIIVWTDATTHQYSVCCETKSPGRYRFMPNGPGPGDGRSWALAEVPADVVDEAPSDAGACAATSPTRRTGSSSQEATSDDWDAALAAAPGLTLPMVRVAPSNDAISTAVTRRKARSRSRPASPRARIGTLTLTLTPLLTHFLHPLPHLCLHLVQFGLLLAV